MVAVAAQHRVVIELAKAPCERHMLGARDVLPAQEQHLVREQQRADLCEERVVTRCITERDAGQFGADGAGQSFDLDRVPRRRGANHGGCRWGFMVHVRAPNISAAAAESSPMYCSACGHAPNPEAGLRWPTSPRSSSRLPQARANSAARSKRHSGSLRLAATMLKNGRRSRGTGNQPRACKASSGG